MQGKILSPQLISGDDGKRYEYDKNDVVNLGNRDLALLTGSQVEFLSFDKRVAKSIYIILSADRISPARTMALWGIGLLFFNFILDIGLLFLNFIPDIWQNIAPIIGIVGFVLYSMAIYSVRKAAASKNLFKNYIKAIITTFLCSYFFLMPAIKLLNSEHVDIFTSVIAVFVFALIALIAANYLYKIHTELARLSGSSLFLRSFWIFVVSVLLCFFGVFGIFVGFAVFIIAWVIHFIAWWRFKKVEKS